MAYYDLTIDRVHIGDPGPPERGMSDDKPVFIPPVTVNAPSEEEWLQLWREYGEPSGPDEFLCRACFTDNTLSGNGLYLVVYAGESQHELFAARIPTESLDVWIEALQAIKRLREAAASTKRRRPGP